jgi:hypothetical protein
MVSIAPTVPDLSKKITLECVKLGTSYVLHSPVSGAILLTNVLGKKLYFLWQSSKTTQHIAEIFSKELKIDPAEATTLITHITQKWQEAGLLQQTPLPVLNPVTIEAPAPSVESFTVGTKDYAVKVVCSDILLTQQLREILQSFLLGADVACKMTISVNHSPQGMAVFKNNVPIWGFCNRDEARNLVIRAIVTGCCADNETAAILHASCVADNKGKSLMIAGRSGSGKSTLAAALVAKGLDYVADDHVPLHSNGKQVMAFPVSLGLKEGSWQLDSAKKLGFSASKEAATARSGVCYRPLKTRLQLGERRDASYLIFPHYAENQTKRMEVLSAEEALQYLIDAGARLTREGNSIIPLARLLNSTPAYKLLHSSSEYAVSECLKLLAKPN